MAEAHRLVVGEWERGRRRRHDEWLATRREWPAQWRSAARESTSHFELTAEEAAELDDELQAVVMRWAARLEERAETPERAGARTFEVQINVFPNGEPPQDPADGQ
jgi:hypothetical protein